MNQRIAWCTFIAAATLTVLCTSGLAQQPPASERTALVRCRDAAGFDADHQFARAPTSEAVEICRTVAEASPLGAAYLARSLYQAGQGGEAYKWILRAVAADLPIGHVLHGVAHERGYGVERSAWRAVDHYRKAAAAGHLNGHHNLAAVLLRAERLKADWHEIIPSVNAAASRNYAPALNRLAWLAQRGVVGVTEGEGKKSPVELYERAAVAGDKEALFNWAVLNLRSQTGHALRRLRASVDKGYCPAKTLLADLHRYGRLVDKDWTAAVKLLMPCSELSHQAKWALGALGRDGLVPEVTVEQARKYLAESQNEMAEDLQSNDGPARYWDPDTEPSPRHELLYELAQSGSRTAILRVKAAGALRAHEIAKRLGPELTVEALADLMSEGHPAHVRDGARQLAEELGLIVAPFLRSAEIGANRSTSNPRAQAVSPSETRLRPDLKKELVDPNDEISDAALSRALDLDSVSLDPIVKSLIGANTAKAKTQLIALAKERLIPLPASIYATGIKDSNENRRSVALRAAAFNGVVLTEAQLIQLSKDKSESVRTDLFYYGARAGWNFPPALLIEALRSTSAKTVDAAARAAAASRDPAVRAQLIVSLGTPRGGQAAEALRSLGGGDESSAWVRSLSDQDMLGKSEGVLEVVESLQPQRIAAAISEMLNAPEAPIRRRALQVIQRSGSQMHKAAVADLALRDPDSEVRKAAVLVLLDAWTPDGLRVLESATHDASAAVRARALEGLGPDPIVARARAMQLATDPDRTVRYRAARILKSQAVPLTSEVASRLRADADESVREVFKDEETVAEMDADVQRLNSLPHKARLAEACLHAFSKPQTLPVLLTLASDRASTSEERSRAMYCVNRAARHGLSEEQIALIDGIARDPTSERYLVVTAQDALENVINPSAARAVMRQAFMHSSTCAIRMRMASFPERARNEAARDYLLVPNIAVQQHTLECMGAQGAFAKYVVRSLRSKGALITPAEVDALTRLEGAGAADALLKLLPSVTEEDDRLALLQGVWETRSNVAHEHAMTYRGSLPALSGSFTAWAWAVAEKPTQAAMDRLMQELSRASSRNEEPVYAALSLSARLPSGALDLTKVVSLQRIIGDEIFGWEVQDPSRLASPLAFLTQCIRTRAPEAQKMASDYVNNEYMRLLPGHAEAIGRTFVQCTEWHSSNGLPYPRTFQGIAKKLLLAAGRVNEARGLGAPAEGEPQRDPLLALTEAEIESALGNHVAVLHMLDHIEQQVLPNLSVANGSKKYFLRLSWLRGRTLGALARNREAIPWLQLAAAKAGRQSTGILAVGELIRLGIKPNYETARWMADKFELREQSGTQVVAAMSAIMEHLVEVEAESGKVEQSLLDADRLGALSVAGTRSVPATLADKEKESALRQLLELERRVAEAEARSTKDVAVARQRLQAWLADIRVRHPTMADFLRPQPARLADIRAVLGPKRALVQYVVLPTRSYVWVVSASSQKLVSIPMGARQIYANVAQVRGAIFNASIGAPEYQNAVRVLSAALVAPVRELTDATHWVVVPHASIHALPFGVLRTEGQTLLASRVTLSMAMSAASVALLREPPKSDSSQLLAIGDASPFDTALAPLPFAKKEVDDIAALAPTRTIVKTNLAAVRKLLLGAETGGQSLHLALHGQVQPGDQSRLVFADGYLTVRDIWGLPLRGSPRVVLSACESGLGEAVTGNDVLSLANAFQVAGAESVVSTLWPIRDESTAKLMKYFYEALARGHTTAQALADAQRKAIDAGWSPDRWAGFIAHGL